MEDFLFEKIAKETGYILLSFNFNYDVNNNIKLELEKDHTHIEIETTIDKKFKANDIVNLIKNILK